VKLAATVLTFALAATSHAQTTWKGLHFGQSRDDVRNALAAQHVDVETSQEGSLQSDTDYQLFVPGLRHTLPFRTDLRFTDAGGLMDITLWLDLRALRENYPEYRTDDTLLGFAADKLTRSLTDIYAAPVTTTSECDADPTTLAKPQPIGCTINWHSPAQSVSIDWLTHPTHLFIRYQMLSPDL
jgi:hypothetical protein